MGLIKVRVAVFAVLMAAASPLFGHGPASAVSRRGALAPSARGPAATVDAFHAALHRGDTSAAVALLADDALIFEAGGVERTKKEYAANHLRADAEFSRSVESITTRRAGSSNGALAWVASEGRTMGTFKGRSMDRTTAETVILRRTARTWKIVHIHWSSAAAR